MSGITEARRQILHTSLATLNQHFPMDLISQVEVPVLREFDYQDENVPQIQAPRFFRAHNKGFIPHTITT